MTIWKNTFIYVLECLVFFFLNTNLLWCCMYITLERVSLMYIKYFKELSKHKWAIFLMYEFIFELSEGPWKGYGDLYKEEGIL